MIYLIENAQHEAMLCTEDKQRADAALARLLASGDAHYLEERRVGTVALNLRGQTIATCRRIDLEASEEVELPPLSPNQSSRRQSRLMVVHAAAEAARLVGGSVAAFRVGPRPYRTVYLTLAKGERQVLVRVADHPRVTQRFATPDIDIVSDPGVHSLPWVRKWVTELLLHPPARAAAWLRAKRQADRSARRMASSGLSVCKIRVTDDGRRWRVTVVREKRFAAIEGTGFVFTGSANHVPFARGGLPAVERAVVARLNVGISTPDDGGEVLT